MTFLRKAESKCDGSFFPIAKLILLGAARQARELEQSSSRNYIPNAFWKRSRRRL